MSDMRKQLFESSSRGEAPLASSYHVLGAARLAAMHLARQWYRDSGSCE